MFADPQFFEFNAYERLAWVYILSYASQKNSGEVLISVEHAETIGKIPRESMESALKKLNDLGCISTEVTGESQLCFKRAEARNRLKVAMRNGQIEKPEKCQFCKHKTNGLDAIQNDLSKPLSVVWICRKCKSKQQHPACDSDSHGYDSDSPPTDGRTNVRDVRNELENTNVFSSAEPITGTPQRRKPTRSDFLSVNDMAMNLPKHTTERWISLYPDSEFLKREIIKAFGYYQDNARKKPKSVRGWCQALSSWLERAWSKSARFTKGTGGSVDWNSVFTKG